MALTAVDKMKLSKYLKNNAIGDIYYKDMCVYLGKLGKISDLEFIEYFTDCVINEFRKDGKISIKQVSKLISIINNFLGWMHEEGSEITEDVLDKIRSFDELYDEYLLRNVMDCDTDFRENCILVVLDKVNKLYPSDKNTESVAKYINMVADLEKEIKELKKSLADATREYGTLQESYDKKSEEVVSLSSDVSSLRGEVKEKKQEILELTSTIEELSKKIESLEKTLLQVQDDNAFLAPFKQQYEELNGEVIKLRKVINDANKMKKKADKQQKKDEKIEALIYQKLLVESASIDDLLRVISENGLVSDSSEVARLLKQMKSRININNSTFSTKPNYKIVMPRLEVDGTFFIDVPLGCKHYDIMLTADFHLREVNSKTLESFDMLNDYCAANGISLILNLGDFYHGFSTKEMDYPNAINNYKVVDDSIKEIPRADGIYHAVLGGNHDRNVSSYGFDPIKMLCDERADFINLGYFHSTVAFNNPTGFVGQFDIHHPADYAFPVDIDDDGLNIGYMDEYLKEMYERLGRDRNNSYIDIFGHTHKSQFNYAGGYCYIPPFIEKKNKRGACHLRIYVDDETGIKYMVFMPLSVGNKLIKNNEIVYQKVLSR